MATKLLVLLSLLLCSFANGVAAEDIDRGNDEAIDLGDEESGDLEPEKIEYARKASASGSGDYSALVAKARSLLDGIETAKDNTETINDAYHALSDAAMIDETKEVLELLSKVFRLLEMWGGLAQAQTNLALKDPENEDTYRSVCFDSYLKMGTHNFKKGLKCVLPLLKKYPDNLDLMHRAYLTKYIDLNNKLNQYKLSGGILAKMDSYNWATNETYGATKLQRAQFLTTRGVLFPDLSHPSQNAIENATQIRDELIELMPAVRDSKWPSGENVLETAQRRILNDLICAIGKLSNFVGEREEAFKWLQKSKEEEDSFCADYNLGLLSLHTDRKAAMKLLASAVNKAVGPIEKSDVAVIYAAANAHEKSMTRPKFAKLLGDAKYKAAQKASGKGVLANTWLDIVNWDGRNTRDLVDIPAITKSKWGYATVTDEAYSNLQHLEKDSEILKSMKNVVEYAAKEHVRAELPESDLKIVELGPTGSYFGRVIKERFSDSKLTVVDPSGRVIKGLASEDDSPYDLFLEQDPLVFTRDKENQKTFDFVFVPYAVHAYQEWTQTQIALLNLVKKGGFLVVGFSVPFEKGFPCNPQNVLHGLAEWQTGWYGFCSGATEELAKRGSPRWTLLRSKKLASWRMLLSGEIISHDATYFIIRKNVEKPNPGRVKKMTPDEADKMHSISDEERLERQRNLQDEL